MPDPHFQATLTRSEPITRTRSEWSTSFCLELKRLVAGLAFCRMSRTLLVQINGLGLVLRCSMYSSIAATDSGTLVSIPRRKRSVVALRTKRSTMLKHEAEFAVKYI